MKRIKLLSSFVADQIAAGEIIERPSCIVRELIDNSIDAGSDFIFIKLTSDSEGDFKILIRDNGNGINPDDLEIAFKRHATSKIETVEDIYSLSSLGFRGEALASIASVSFIKVTTCTNDLGEGVELSLQGGKKVERKIVSCKKGTQIEISQIFYNMPVRKKFLKRKSFEKMEIKNQMIRQVLSTQKISFHYIVVEGGKETEERVVKKEDTLKDRISLFFNQFLVGSLLEVNEVINDIKLTGYISSTAYQKGKNRKNQFFFVKGRPVTNKTLLQSYNAAYLNLLPSKSFGSCFLTFDFPLYFVDINVHPSKKEVKFKQERDVYLSIYKTVKKTLYDAVMENKKEDFSFSSPNFTSDTLSASLEKEIKSFGFQTENFKPMDTLPKSDVDQKEQKNYFASLKEKTIPKKSNLMEQDLEFHLDEKKNFVILGQIGKVYILFSNGKDLFVMDQHAADERRNFDEIKKKIEDKKKDQQFLLTPIVIEKDEMVIDFLVENEELLNRLELKLERINKKCVQVERIPAFFPKGKEEALLSQIIDLFFENKYLSITDLLEKLISTIACRMSIMAGDSLSEGQMQFLIRALGEKNLMDTCPHGRPFIKKITFDELSRFFDRSCFSC